MAVKETLQIGHPLLKAPNQDIDLNNAEEIRLLIEDLKDTMYEHGLIGMAAPQIGVNKNIFITEPKESPYRTADQADELRVFINPKIVGSSDEEVLIYEGCGSVLHANLFGPVMRPRVITIRATDDKGNKFEFTADGILGRVIQHEYDHLLGIEYLEKVVDYAKFMNREHYIEKIKSKQWHQKNSHITIKEYKKI